MSLASRLGGTQPSPASTANPDSASAAQSASASERSQSPSDPLAALKERAQAELYDRIGPRLYEADLDSAELEALVVSEIDRVLAVAPVSLTAVEQNSLVSAIRDDVLGLGPIQCLIDDPTISEIMVNGPEMIYVERQGRLEKSGARFTSEQHLRQIIDRIVAPIGRRVDESSPMVDGRLSDGSRVNAIIAPLAVRGSSLTIRKFPDRALTMSDLILSGSITQGGGEFLQACVVGGLNIIVSGGTGTGKTTMLNLLSGFIPAHERVVTIEDAVELRLVHENLVSLEARPANAEGVGAVMIRDLVKNALRMRPDRIVVGECRGGEALDMLQAMNTGHEGSLTTAHANSGRDLLARLETMVLMAELDLPSRAIRDQIASAVQLVVHLHRLQDGRRAITSISEIVGTEEDRILMSDIFAFDWSAPPLREGFSMGQLRPTGVRPMFEDRLTDRGVTLSRNIFDEDS